MADFETARRRMVDNQLRTSNVTDRRVLAAMGAVPREQFLSLTQQDLAYADTVHPIGDGRALGAPVPFAKLLQLAAIEHTDRVLDVAIGTGYSTAVLAQLAAEVTGIESAADLADAARRNLAAVGAANTTVVTAPLNASVAALGQFDVIIVEGALDTAPSHYFSSLRDGGRLVALILKGATAEAHVYVRSGADVAARTEFNASLPPIALAPRSDVFVF
jgi:protein-L-isoaspartate(D-aspartate) O-methyltransferase